MPCRSNGCFNITCFKVTSNVFRYNFKVKALKNWLPYFYKIIIFYWEVFIIGGEIKFQQKYAELSTCIL